VPQLQVEAMLTQEDAMAMERMRFRGWKILVDLTGRVVGLRGKGLVGLVKDRKEKRDDAQR